MKRVVLRPRGGRARPLRSDTLFGLLAWGVREVAGRGALDRLLEPPSGAEDEPALVVTSAFPCAAERSWFPRPVDEGPGLQDDATLLARIGGGAPATDPAPPPSAPHDLFFLAYGRAEPWLEGALRYLERAGFGGGAARGESGYDVTLEETSFVRPARPGELGLLLSLCFPTATERAALATAARERSDVRYQVERRRGVVGGRRLSVARPFKKAVTMLREGSVLPVAGVGAAPVVGRVEAEGEAFDVRQPGYGFFVPWTGGGA